MKNFSGFLDAQGRIVLGFEQRRGFSEHGFRGRFRFRVQSELRVMHWSRARERFERQREITIGEQRDQPARRRPVSRIQRETARELGEGVKGFPVLD